MVLSTSLHPARREGTVMAIGTALRSRARVGLGAVAVTLLAVVAVVGPAAPARAAVINVSTTTDGVAGSLRSAITAANAAGDVVTINLAASATYDLTVCGTAEDANASGDVDLTASWAVTLNGNGSTVPQTCANARVFDHHGPGDLTLN